MGPEHQFKHLTDLFEQARALSVQGREALLDKACADNQELRKQVELLLERHDEGGLLDEPLSLGFAEDERTPSRIGAYEIIEVLGKGGMGMVYRARQSSPEREVAIKILRLGLDTPKLRQRFEFETAVLARLKHPSIATIFDVGTCDDGSGPRPYYAMELVEGRTLNNYIKDNTLTLEEKLVLVIAICDGVQHAHQKGVIHRDLKPQNILMDETGSPKILDFGVARSTDHELTIACQTQAGELVGTLVYMSPEQVGPNSDAIDTRSDVYSLGVVLYEMLAGQLPYDMSDTSISGISRVIGEKPPVALADADRSLRGDLNTIALQALRKNPGQRYQSASELGDDLCRYLNHEPISARPATLRYLTGRFVRRHRGLVAAMLLLSLTVTGALGVVIWQTARADAESETRQDVALFLEEMLTSLDPAKTGGKPLTVREMLDDSSARLHDRFASAPAVRGELHVTIARTYHQLGEFEQAKEHYELAIEDLETHMGKRDDETLRTMGSLGLTLSKLGKLDDAESVILDAQGRLRSEDGRVAAFLRLNMINVLNGFGRYDEAIRLAQVNLEHHLSSDGPDDFDTLISQNNLGSMLMDTGRFDEAGPLLEDCLQRRRDILGSVHPYTIASIANLGVLYSKTGRLEDALPLVLESAETSERVLGPRHLDTMKRRQHIIRHHLTAQQFDQAAQAALLLIADWGELFEPDHPELMSAHELAVTAAAFSGDLEGATAIAHDLHKSISQVRSLNHHSTGRAAYLLYNLYDELDDDTQAQHWYQAMEQSAFSP